MTANAPDPAEKAAFSGSTGAPSRRRIGLVLGGAALLAVAAVTTSLAASSAPSAPSKATTHALSGAGLTDDESAAELGRGGRAGFREITIQGISGNDVTLVTDDGWRRTVTVTSTVKLTKGGQDITVSGLKVGDEVRLRQTRNDDGTYTVTALAVVVPTINGRASAITSTGFKVTTRDGSVWTVTVNGSTTYGFGQGTGSLADVKDGEGVHVAGTVTADNAMTATNVRVAADRAAGKVTAKTANTLTIERRDGSKLTIHVDADTTYRVAGAETADLGDVTVDMAIGISGRTRADGSLDADTVVAGKLRGLGRGWLDGRKGAGGFGPGAVPPEAQPAIDFGVEIPTA
jgi:Domain of unknown function (DUF5666)